MSESDVKRALDRSAERTTNPWEPNSFRKLMFKYTGHFHRSPLELLYDFWWSPRAEKKRMKNPEYARMDALLRRDGGGLYMRPYGKPEENEFDMFDHIDLGHKIAPHPWWWKLHHWLKNNGVRAQKSRIKTFWQRGTRGWSDYDIWSSLDSWLSQVIIGSVSAFRDMPPHGWPGDPITYEEWIQILDDIVEGFKAHQTLMDVLHDGSQDAELKARYDNGMKLFAEYFGSLWD